MIYNVNDFGIVLGPASLAWDLNIFSNFRWSDLESNIGINATRLYADLLSGNIEETGVDACYDQYGFRTNLVEARLLYWA